MIQSVVKKKRIKDKSMLREYTCKRRECNIWTDPKEAVGKVKDSKWKRKVWSDEYAFRPQLTTGQVNQYGASERNSSLGIAGTLVKCAGSLQLIKVSSRGNFAFVGVAGAYNDSCTTGISAGADFRDRRANRKSIFQGRLFGILDGIFFSAATVSDISGYTKFDERTRISDYATDAI